MIDCSSKSIEYAPEGDYIKDELVSYELPTMLDGIIELAARSDLCIQAH